MKNKKPFEKYDTLINELVKAHDTICLSYKVQKELNVPDDITNKLIDNMINLFDNLKKDYPKNINIIEED